MRVTNWQKLLYASGSLGVALSYQAFAFYIQFVYIDTLGLKASLVGVGWSIYGIWNAVNDPFVGFLSDNTRTRFGRRVPWIVASFIPLSLFFYLLWVPPSPLVQGGQTPLFVYFMSVVLIFDLLWSIVAMNWTSLFPEMFSTTSERAGVSALRQSFAVLGLLIGVALPPLLVGPEWANRGGMAVLLAVITAITLGLSVLGSRENRALQAQPQPAFMPAVKASMRNSAFRWFLAANLHKEFIYIMLGASIPFWAKYVLNVREPVPVAGLSLDAALQNSLLVGLAFIMALPGMPIWMATARRIGSTRGWQVAQGTFGLSMLLVFFARDFIQGAIATALVGLSLAGMLVFPDLLLSDIIDEDETATGARREGMYFGINGFIIRLAFIMQGITTGLVLSWTNYVATSGGDLFPQQPASAVLGIRFMVAVIPMLASLLIILLLARYPLQGKRLAQLRGARLAAAPAAAEGAIGR